jgi:nucleoside-diphosphate-sugar epimerase
MCGTVPRVKVLVTGGGGFLGTAIVRAWLARGAKVRVLGRSDYPKLRAAGVECIRGDVGDIAAVERAVEGCDSIFHVAAKVGYWGPLAEYRKTNIAGTENMLAAAKKFGVPRFVYTSSPSVVIGDRGGFENADETVGYPARYLYHYAETKAAGEALVLKANDAQLATVAIRPHFIFGPGDPQIVPRLLDAAKKGKLVRVGRGDNKVDVTYIDNCVEAHLLAHDALERADSRARGQAYFIGQEKPVLLWEFIAKVLEGFGAPPVKKKIPFSVARALGAVVEMVYRVFRLSGEPPLTRSAAIALGTSHYFSHEKAARDFGYVPKVTVEEGLARVFRAGLAEDGSVRWEHENTSRA